jgi:HAD superfamily hydrolase (TIGR01509 family)
MRVSRWTSARRRRGPRSARRSRTTGRTCTSAATRGRSPRCAPTAPRRCARRSARPRFSPYPDAAPALRELRAAGWGLVVVSNWDASLHERLAETGLAGLLDGAVASAELGAAKPDGAIFARALALAGAEPGDAWHVGDDVEADVEGALAAGIRPVLLARDGDPPALEGVPVIRSLAALPPLLKRF